MDFDSSSSQLSSTPPLEWVQLVVRRLDRADLTLNAADLKGSHHRVYYFGNHFEEK
jgi:hypothetical protein